MTVAAYRISPLDNRAGQNGYPQSDYRPTPANRIWHEIKVERFRRWREAALITVMREDMMLCGQCLNGHGLVSSILEFDNSRKEMPTND